MSLCGGGNQTSTTTTTIPPWLQSAVQGLITQGQNLSTTPYQPYGGPRVAGFSPDQQQAFDLTQQNVGSYQPFLNQASGALGQAGGLYGQAGNALGQAGSLYGQAGDIYNSGLGYLGQANGMFGQAGNIFNQVSQYTPSQYQSQDFDQAAAQRYLSPYTQDVIDSLTNQMNRQRDIQSKGIGDAAAKSGGFGGYRQGVMEAENNRNWNDLTNQAVAQQYQHGFENAQSQFNADQARSLAGAQLNAQTGLQGQQLKTAAGQGFAGLGQGLAGLGQTTAGIGSGVAGLGSGFAGIGQGYAGLGAGMAGLGQGYAGLGQQAQQLGQGDISQLLGSGGLQQALGQQGLDVGYNNYLAAQQWPFQTAGFLSDIIHGAPSGQTSVTSQPGPSTLSTLLGLGVGGLSLAGGLGAFG